MFSLPRPFMFVCVCSNKGASLKCRLGAAGLSHLHACHMHVPCMQLVDEFLGSTHHRPAIPQTYNMATLLDELQMTQQAPPPMKLHPSTHSGMALQHVLACDTCCDVWYLYRHASAGMGEGICPSRGCSHRRDYSCERLGQGVPARPQRSHSRDGPMVGMQDQLAAVLCNLRAILPVFTG